MTLRIASTALARNKLRSGLTMLGIIIGVAAVIALVALGNGARIAIEEQVRNGGANMVQVFAGSSNQGGVSGGADSAPSLQIEDAIRIREELPAVEYLAVGVRSSQQVVAGNQNWFTRVQGTDVDLPKMRAWPIKSGSFFTEEDVELAARVCVLGQFVNEQLFGVDGDGIGQTIRIRNQPCKVIGVMGPKGTTTDGNMDDQVLAPYTTVMKRLIGQKNITAIMMTTKDPDSVPRVASALPPLLRAWHRLPTERADDFSVRTVEEMAQMRSETTETMTMLLAGIGGVSLIVGGIGIMNIMLVSVTERTREIGLRMAMGAKGGNVRLQFLVESLVLSFIGGTIGVVLGVGIALGLERWMAWPVDVPQSVIAIAFAFSAAVGVFFGFYPAQKAARLDPIEALRFE